MQLRGRAALVAVAALIALVALVLVAACDKGVRPSHEREPVRPQPPPPPADAMTPPDASVADVDPMLFCDLARALLKRGIQCAPVAAKQLQDMLAALDVTIAEVPADPSARSARERQGGACALTAHVYDQRLATVTDVKCEPTLTGDERARTRAYLRFHYGRRTKPRPTGDATIDRQLAELAASRDVMCNCTDRNCMHEAHKTVTAAVKPIPREMANAMADGEAIVDEVSRCADRIDNNLDRLLPRP